MRKLNDGSYNTDKGFHFVLTGKGKTWASYKNYKVGEPISDDDTWASSKMVEDGVVEEVPIPDWVVTTGWKVVYDYNGYQLPAGNPIIFPDLELAKNYMNYYARYPWMKNKPYIIESTYEGKTLSKCKLHNGKSIYNYDWFITFDAFKSGDYVCEEIADNVLNALPPRYWSGSLIQCGEPTTSREDEKTGKMRNTYLTLKKIADGIWEYCGDCFVGETEMRGKEMQYV